MINQSQVYSEPNRAAHAVTMILRLLLGAIFCAAGAFYVYTAIGIRVPPLGDALGPRLFPIVIGSAFLLFSVVYAVGEIRQRNEKDDAFMADDISSQMRVGLTFAIILLYCLLFSLLGYLPATFLSVFAMLAVLRFRGVLGNVIGAALTTCGFYFVFGAWLGVPLPILGW